MSKILIVAATRFEIAPLLAHFNVPVYKDSGFFISDHQSPLDLSVIISGVGMVNTAYYLGRYSHNLFDHVINAGVGGAFNRHLEIGEVVNVVEDRISELGAEDGDAFIRYEEMNLRGTSVYTHQWEADLTPLKKLKQVKGITVNTVHGDEHSIKKIIDRFNPDVESMEGAAFFRGCSRLSGNYTQIRSISNYVEKRDKSKWNMPLAINRLNEFMIPLINDLNS